MISLNWLGYCEFSHPFDGLEALICNFVAFEWFVGSDVVLLLLCDEVFLELCMLIYDSSVLVGLL